MAPLTQQVLAGEIHHLPGQQLAPDGQELAGLGITLVMVQEHPVAGQFQGIASGHQVDQQASPGQAVEGGGLAGSLGGRDHAGPQGDQELQPLGGGNQGRGHDPGIFTRLARGNQDAAEPQAVGGLGHLAQIGVVHCASALEGAEVTAVAVGGQKPEYLHVGCSQRFKESAPRWPPKPAPVAGSGRWPPACRRPFAGWPGIRR